MDASVEQLKRSRRKGGGRGGPGGGRGGGGGGLQRRERACVRAVCVRIGKREAAG